VTLCHNRPKKPGPRSFCFGAPAPPSRPPLRLARRCSGCHQPKHFPLRGPCKGAASRPCPCPRSLASPTTSVNATRLQPPAPWRQDFAERIAVLGGHADMEVLAEALGVRHHLGAMRRWQRTGRALRRGTSPCPGSRRATPSASRGSGASPLSAQSGRRCPRRSTADRVAQWVQVAVRVGMVEVHVLRCRRQRWNADPVTHAPAEARRDGQPARVLMVLHVVHRRVVQHDLRLHLAHDGRHLPQQAVLVVDLDVVDEAGPVALRPITLAAASASPRRRRMISS